MAIQRCGESEDAGCERTVSCNVQSPGVKVAHSGMLAVVPMYTVSGAEWDAGCETLAVGGQCHLVCCLQRRHDAQWDANCPRSVSG